ncbi:MAG: hypothetical protein ACRDIX_07640 [Actinomycetota bacterium]
MPELPPLTTILLLALLGVFLVFALGTSRNIRKGNELLRWLQGGLPLLGARTTLRWLGSTAAILKIQEAKDPFRETEVVVVLKPRDVTFLWAWARARGRGDFVILRGRLRGAPRFELEAGDRRGWTGLERIGRLDMETWREGDWGDPNLRVAHSGDADPGLARGAWDDLTTASGGVWRLSIRRDNPHLEVHVLPPDLAMVPADRLVEAFRSLGKAVARKS